MMTTVVVMNIPKLLPLIRDDATPPERYREP